MGTLTVHRTSPRDMEERELYIKLDGAAIGILRFRDSITVPIAPGRHELRVHNTISRKRAEFDVAPGQQVRFSAVNMKGKHFGLLAMFLGIAPMYTILERDDDASPA